jgi:hypothetical protein
MRKFIITSILALTIFPVFASDYIPQEVTSEVYTEQVQVTEERYQETRQVNQRPYRSTYCLYKNDREYCNKSVPQSYNLKPVTVYTGKTVTVQKHYDVYQPKVIYQKVNSYTTTQTCEYCD